jgi:hypothetical protein
MILYALRCDDGHEFEAWFRDSAAYDAQEATGLLSCPQCGSEAVTRGLMAPAVRAGTAGAAPRLPDAVRVALQRLRADVEHHCDPVGDRFAEEALRIHRGLAERRGIYGNATEAEREALVDEGVEVGLVPWLPRADG